MLTWLRGKTGSFMVKILLGLLVISFAVWGISGQIFTGVGNHVVAVGDTRVSVNEYRLAYDRQIQLLSQQFGTRITREQARAFGLEQQVLAQLVAGAALDEQAREMRLGLSRDRLASLTAQDPAFQDSSGRFDRNQFQFVLQQVGMRPEDYLRTREQAAMRQQIVEAVASEMTSPETFLNAVALYRGEDRTVEFLALPRSLVEPLSDPSDETLAAWFAENESRYAAPEYRAISYVLLQPEEIADPAAVTQDEVEGFYETHRETFASAERRRIRQIVFPDRAAAEEAAERIDSGEATFDDIAQELGRSADDLLLGQLTQAEVPDPAIAEAAFSLEEGATSGVVDGAFGAVIVNVENIEPETVRPLDEVEPEIREEIALDEATRTLLDVYDAYEDARAGGASMAEAAAAQDLEVIRIEAVDAAGRTPQGDMLDELPVAQDLLQEAFDAEPGMENPAINIGSSGYVFFEVDDITPARQRPLEEVRETVLADWRNEEAHRLLAERAGEIEARLSQGEEPGQVSEELSLELQTKRGLRRGANDPDIGRAGVDAAFGMPVGGVAVVPAQEGNTQIVLKVTEVFAPANTSSDSLPQDLRDNFATGYADDVLDQLVARLQAQYRVSVNQGAIQQALSF